ncbi:MAG: hypothetical protein DRP35_10320, partial [Candidatus Zixiibacteriota bacterium]
EKCKIGQIYDAALTNQNEGNPASQTDIIYRNNLIYNSEWSYEYWNRDSLSETKNVYFINNTCINAGKSWGHLQRPIKRGRHIYISQNEAATNNFYILNNIFYKATSSCLFVLRASDLDSFNIDYNCWYQSGNDTLINISWGSAVVDYYTMSGFSDYQTDYQQDSNSIATYPIFVDTLNNDFDFSALSPCIDAGTPDTTNFNTGLEDFDGNNRILDGDNIPPAVIDIGCYEYDYTSGISTNSFNGNSFKVYPNPASSYITIEFENNQNAVWDVSLINIKGQEILQKDNITEPKFIIKTKGISKGVYLLQLTNEEGQMFSRKIIVK